MSDKQTFRSRKRELNATIDEYSDIQTDHVSGGGHSLTDANWPPGAIREFDDDGMLKRDDLTVKVTAVQTFDADAPAHRFQALLDDLDDLGADVTVEVKKTIPGRPPEVRDSGVVVPQGPADPDRDGTATYIRVSAEVDLTDELTSKAPVLEKVDRVDIDGGDA